GHPRIVREHQSSQLGPARPIPGRRRCRRRGPTGDPAPRTPGWGGRVDHAPGRLTFSGVLGSAGLHAHAAVQVLDLHTGAAVLRDRAGRECRVTDTAVIPTRIDHEIPPIPGTIGSITSLDPSTDEAPEHTARLRARGTDLSAAETWICPI